MMLVRDLIIKSLIKRLVLLVPFFGYPVVGPIFAYAVTKISEYFFTEIYYHSVFISIEIKVNKQRKKYEEAVAVLDTHLNSELISEEAKEKAKNEFKKRLSDLINMV